MNHDHDPRSGDDGDRDLAGRLEALPRAIEPGRDLWSGVGQRIAAKKRRSTLARRTATGGVALLAAAAVALWIGRGHEKPQAMNTVPSPVPSLSAPAPVVAPAPAFPQVVAAAPVAPVLPEEASYVTALNALTPVFDERKKDLPPEGIEALAKSLSALDSAIAATRASLLVAPGDDHLRTELDSEYEKKIDMMNDVLEWTTRS